MLDNFLTHLRELALSQSITDSVFRTFVVVAIKKQSTLLELSKTRRLRVDTIKGQVIQLEELDLVRRRGALVFATLHSLPKGENSSSKDNSIRSNRKKRVRVTRGQTRASARRDEQAENRDLTAVLRSVYDTTTKFDRLPNVGYPAKALDTVTTHDVEIVNWPPLAVTGYYLRQYERRYRRKWRASRDGLKRLHGEMKTLIQREGTEDTVLGIEAVFSPKLKWVTNHMGALLSKDAFAKHIVPVMDAIREERRPAGEQAEWGPDRSKKGYIEVKL